MASVSAKSREVVFSECGYLVYWSALTLNWAPISWAVVSKCCNSSPQITSIQRFRPSRLNGQGHGNAVPLRSNMQPGLLIRTQDSRSQRADLAAVLA